MSTKKQAGQIKPPAVASQQCSSCIFRTDGSAVDLAPGRLEDIKHYLINGTPHECHGPQLQGKKTKIICRGGRDFQLQVWHRMGMIEEPTDNGLRETMVKLGLWIGDD